mgnify:FL=1
MNIGNKIKELRAEHNLTQKELAAAIKVSNGCIAMIETGKNDPTANTLLKYADFFQCSTDYLLGREDNRGVIHVYPQTDKLDSLSADEQKLIDLIRKNPPLNATDWIELYAELPRYMQENIFAELRGMHMGFKAAKAEKAGKNKK